jgi:hypothetical protein
MTKTIIRYVTNYLSIPRSQTRPDPHPTHHQRFEARFPPPTGHSAPFKTHSLRHRSARASGSLLTTLSKVPSGQL